MYLDRATDTRLIHITDTDPALKKKPETDLKTNSTFPYPHTLLHIHRVYRVHIVPFDHPPPPS